MEKVVVRLEPRPLRHDTNASTIRVQLSDELEFALKMFYHFKLKLLELLVDKEAVRSVNKFICLLMTRRD